MKDRPRTGTTGRILVVTQDFEGGTGQHLGMMIRHWHASGWDVQAICHGAVNAHMARDVSLTVAPPASFVRGFPFAQWRCFRQVRDQVRRFQPDVVHCFFFWSWIYGRILRARGSRPALVENREDQGFNLRTVEYAVLRRSAGVPDRVICVSDAVRNVVLAKEHVPPARTLVIHNGIEPLTTSHDRGAARRELGLEDDVPLVGLVANLNRPVKGVEHFIAAMPAILKTIPDTRFVIFGDGHLRSALESEARRRGVDSRVTFAGYRRDMARYYPAFDVSVLTSLSEGLSITLLESMQQGLPVVATRVGGNPELVVDGETGYLVPVKDSGRFAERVCELLRNPERRHALGAAARRRITEQFDATVVARRYLDLFSELMSRADR